MTTTRTAPRLASLAALSALALAGLGPATAQAKDRTLVVPGKSIGGVKLGKTRAAVQKSRPLGLKKPTRTTRDGKRLGHLYATPGFGTVMTILYSGRKRTSKVLFVGTGGGAWHTKGGLVYGSSPLQAVAEVGCDTYGRKSDGSRDYDADFDQTSCEKQYAKRRWFYVSFNAGDSGDIAPALAGFSLSTRRVP